MGLILVKVIYRTGGKFFSGYRACNDELAD